MTISSLWKKSDITLEVVILLIAGMALLITGILLFLVSSGALPYYENGLYGLFLVMFALQIVTMGKTPFGEVHRSRFIIAAGAVIAAVGIVTCFVPDVLTRFSRILLLLTGIFMVLLGVLLIPVNLGKLPFSGSAQLGLLMVIFAIQMLASGNTPIGPFPHCCANLIKLRVPSHRF